MAITTTAINIYASQSVKLMLKRTGRNGVITMSAMWGETVIVILMASKDLMRIRMVIQGMEKGYTPINKIHLLLLTVIFMLHETTETIVIVLIQLSWIIPWKIKISAPPPPATHNFMTDKKNWK